MKFRINAEQLKKAVTPAADVATKNSFKYGNTRAFDYGNMLTIEASSSALNVTAYGGWASINIKANESEGFVCKKAGTITVEAIELVKVLKPFSPTANLSVCGDDYQLKISLESDHKVFTVLPTRDIYIKCPSLPREFVQEATVDRTCFVRGMKKVAWAMSKNEKMSSYMCTSFECWMNRMSFSAGTGGRFAIFEVNKCQTNIVGEDVQILFPSHNIGNIIRIFNKTGSSTIKIRTAEQNSSLGIPEQFLLESGNIVMALYGSEDFSKYPDLKKELNHDHAFKISTRSKDWKDVAKAIHATRPGHDSHIHNTRITADILHGHFNFRTNTKKRMKGKIDFMLGGVIADISKDKAYQPWFVCKSDYIEEIARKGYKDATVIINFDDQTKLDEIPKGMPKQMKPVLITYPIKANKDGTTEKYFIFFTVSAKW